MKKSKKQGAYTAAQDKAAREKLDLVKEKSLIIEEDLRSLEVGKNRSNFILSCFKRVLTFFPTTPPKDSDVEELREWPGLSSLKEADQPMTQEQMEKLWQSTEEYIETYDIDYTEYIFIDFERGTFEYMGSTYSLLEAFIEIAPVSNDPLKGTDECFNLHANNHLRGTVYLVDKWDRGRPVLGLLKTVDDEGKIFFVELKHFSVMTHAIRNNASTSPTELAPHDHAEDKPNKVVAPEDKAKSEAYPASKECGKTMNPNQFILFNKPKNVFWESRF